ncbi:hypothetical protein LB505_014104 [Fusarium chuoi]|nr:hypothetical protein LB505_014104 [Fusarium chuoi]
MPSCRLAHHRRRSISRSTRAARDTLSLTLAMKSARSREITVKPLALSTTKHPKHPAMQVQATPMRWATLVRATISPTPL